MKILVLNGPNLGRLGTRQPDLYGVTTLAELEEALRARGKELGVEVECFQSDDESELVRALTSTDARAVVINPAALTHHSRTIAEAVRACPAAIYEVHITNVEAREPYRRRSLVTPFARGKVIGFGIRGYMLALEAAVEEATR